MFDNDASRHQPRQQPGKKRDQGDQAVAERMAPDDRAGAEPFGAGGSDVILLQHIDHARAGITREAGKPGIS
ncbi:hypothetical protein SDC9_79598 [bioreactor metagenome]|uniref:Uncharacterized protein n=1 Tax=bioreactor metagenome TaxID=1076179 RepID=A0A644YYW6_9ZZZZ